MDKEQDNSNPLAMYLIVRESLNMSIGKTAAQCAHASQILTFKFFEMKEESKMIGNQMQPLLQPKPEKNEIEKLKVRYVELARPISIFGEWMKSSFRKVVLKADDKEWFKLKNEFKDSMVMVVDAGLTEIPNGSETVIGLWPSYKNNVSKTIKKLQVLK